MAAKPYVIIVGTDYSSHGYRAVRAAAREAAKHTFAKLNVAHVVPSSGLEHELPPLAFAGFGSRWGADQHGDSLAKLDEHVAAALSNLALPPELVIETLLLEGDPALELMELGWKLRANLTVVGTRGRQHRAASALGTVAEAVVRQATTPVLVIGPRVQLTPEIQAKMALS